MQIKLINSLSIGFSVCIIAWLTWALGAGFDITDEGFYLNSILHAKSYDGTTSQFGHLYHSFYFLFNTNLYAFRVANALLIYASTMTLFMLCLKAFPAQAEYNNFSKLALSSLLSINCLAYLGIWQPTPNYNTLNIIALNVTASSMLWLHIRPNSFIAALSIGFSGWLTFIAKPTTAICLALFVFIFLFMQQRKYFLRNIFIAGTTASILLLITALLIDGSMSPFIERLKIGIERGSTLLLSKRSLSSLIWNGSIILPSLAAALLIAATIHLAARKINAQHSPLTKNLSTATTIAFGIFSATLILALFGVIDLPLLTNKAQLILVPLIHLTVSFTLISLIRNTNNLKQGSLIICILLTPYAYSSGTTNNYLITSTAVVHFFICAAILEVTRQTYFNNPKTAVYLIAGLSFTLTTLMLLQSAQSPYRQQASIIQQKKSGELGYGPLSSIKIAAQQKHYFNKLRLTLQSNGFEQTTPLIDLTGRSPGALYAIEALPIGAPWLIGGYPGSKERVQMDLGMANKETLKQAWILIESNNRRSITTDILNDLKFPENYIYIGSIKSHYNYNSEDPNSIQDIYKPISTQAFK